LVAGLRSDHFLSFFLSFFFFLWSFLAVLTTMAEAWTKEDVDELIKNLGVGNDSFDYRGCFPFSFLNINCAA